MTPTVWFELPDMFTPLDLGVDGSARSAHLVERSTGLPDDQRLHLVLAQEATVERLRAGGVGLAATSVSRVETPEATRLSTSLFTTTVHAVGRDADVVLDSIAARLDVEGLRREVRTVGVRAGRAVVVLEDRVVSTSVTPFGEKESGAPLVRQAQLMIASPDRRHVAVMSLSTEAIEDWADYMTILGGVAASISFSSPKERAAHSSWSISAVLDGKVR